MRILQVYDLAPEDSGPADGVGLAIWELSLALASIGHDVCLVGGAGRSAKKLSKVDGFTIRRVDRFALMKRTWSTTNLTLGRQLCFTPVVLSNRRLLRELSGFDVVHGHVYSAGLAALVIGKQLGVPVINTVHGSYYNVWDQITNPRLAPLARLAERHAVLYLARNATCQIHADRSFADLVQAWGADPQKLRVIHNGVAQRLLARFAEPPETETPIFFTARRLVRKNGLDLLLRAFSKVARMRTARLRIAGEGPEFGNLVKLADQLHIRDRVEFTGLIPHSSIPEFIHEGSVAVLPSLAEASSLFLLECMALGRPIVCFAVGGIKEIVGKDSAWLVAPGDEDSLAERMMSAIDHPEESLAMVRQAHKLAAEGRTWDRVAAKTVECYERAIE